MFRHLLAMSLAAPAAATDCRRFKTGLCPGDANCLCTMGDSCSAETKPPFLQGLASSCAAQGGVCYRVHHNKCPGGNDCLAKQDRCDPSACPAECGACVAGGGDSDCLEHCQGCEDRCSTCLGKGKGKDCLKHCTGIPMRAASYLAASDVSTNTWSILLTNEDGSLVYYEKNPDRPQIPASNTKVWTTSCAYDLFGPDKVFPWDDDHTIAQACTDILKPSWNDGADHLLDFIGSELAGTSSREEAGEFVMDWARKTAGLNMTGAFQGDGCGLDRDNHFTARQMVGITRWMRNNHPQWTKSLPIGCVDGTLSSRFCDSNVKGRVHAKTGTLHDVHTLSGYVENKHDGKVYYFSVLANDCVASEGQLQGAASMASSLSAIDAVVALLGEEGLPNADILEAQV